MVNYKTGTFNNKITWNHVRYLGLRLTRNTAKKKRPEWTHTGVGPIEEADLCDFNNALIRGFGMLLQGSKFVVAIVANATMFSHLLPGCSCGSKHLLLP